MRDKDLQINVVNCTGVHSVSQRKPAACAFPQLSLRVNQWESSFVTFDIKEKKINVRVDMYVFAD